MSQGSLPVRKEAWSGGDTRLARTVARPMVRFLAQEAASGVLLLVATAVALIWVNSPWSDSYHDLWHTELLIELGSWIPLMHGDHPWSLEFWVNDGLMVLFFFVVGLEIKSELVVGDLNSPRVAALPAIAALGGMVIPAALYAVVNLGSDGLGGWGIPMATDIAFAVGVLALLGSRVPQRLKLFLLTLAIVDDIGAIAVIAIFYSEGLSFGWLGLAVGGLVVVVAMRRFRVWYIPMYVLVGIFVWYATYRSGVHATIAGVALGLLAPAKPLLGPRFLESVEDVISGETVDPASVREANWKRKETVSICGRLIGILSPWTSFVVIPLFALANAGVELSGEAIKDAVSSPVTIGVILGLVIGKPVGIGLFTWAAVRFGVADLPGGVTLRHVVGAGAVAGIGFTVALFISGLAFDDQGIIDQSIIGILVASLVATGVGAAILFSAPSSSDAGSESDASDDEHLIKH